MSDFTARQMEIIELAAGPNSEANTVNYTDEENNTWSLVCRELNKKWDVLAAPEVLSARENFGLDQSCIPQLSEVTDRLRAGSKFEFRAVGGLVAKETFFGGLAERKFLSTQYIRAANSPFYTEQPDIVHEVIGHGTMLADVQLAELHHLAGAALLRVETELSKQFIANVWWFSGEFGLVSARTGAKAFGAGLLSSLAELEHIEQAQTFPLDIAQMGTMAYEIDQLQPRMFVGRSLGHVMDVVGGFFDVASDEQIETLLAGVPS